MDKGLEIGQRLIVLVVVVIDHTDLHQCLTRIGRARAFPDQSVEGCDGGTFVAINQVCIADLEQGPIVIVGAGISPHHLVQHVDFLIRISFGTVTKSLLEQSVVRISLVDTGGQIIIIHGLVIAAVHEEAVAKTDIGIALQV